MFLLYYTTCRTQHTQCVRLMSPQCFPMSYCTMIQSQRRHNFIWLCMCVSKYVCLYLFISLPCLPTRLVLYYEITPKRDIQLASLTGCIFKKLLWSHYTMKSGFFFHHRFLGDTHSHARKYKYIYLTKNSIYRGGRISMQNTLTVAADVTCLVKILVGG